MKYSDKCGTPDIAFFDWNTMFVFNFHGMDEDASDPVLAKGTWFTEELKDPRQGYTFRMILYEFLIRALMRQGIIT